MKVVLDTNTLVFAIGWNGPPRRILEACRRGRFSLITSQPLLQELTRVLAYPKLAPLAKSPDLPIVLAWIHRAEHVVYPSEREEVITADPEDNRVLEAAVAGAADRIVSGDEHLLSLKAHRGIPIVTPAQFAKDHLPADET